MGLLAFKPLVFSHTALTLPSGQDELMVNYDPSRPNISTHVLTFVRGEAAIVRSGSAPEEQTFD